jgi:aspartate kinase
MRTVEKIGGTSMSQFADVLTNIIRVGKEDFRYGRVFVVSAYAGVTDLLLENKKTGEPGVYHAFAGGNEYEEELKALTTTLFGINAGFGAIGLDVPKADDFITARIEQTKNFLYHMAEVIATGYVEKANILRAARELLASIGETHSAYNSVNILQRHGIEAILVDLSGFHDTHAYSLEERIAETFKGIDLDNAIVVATGYTKSAQGIMREFDRGYSEVTFSRIAVELKADEAIIHKEYHLSSADPKIVGIENALPVGFTNYDVADQLADVGMEAIHPKASKPLEQNGINLRIKNTFEPEHPGTLISKEYTGMKSKIEIITGSEKIVVIDIHDSSMVGEVGIDLAIMEALRKYSTSYILKCTNANSISIAVWDSDRLRMICNELGDRFEIVKSRKAAIVCIIGSNIAQPGVLARAARVLFENGVNVECVSQSLRQTNIQFIIDRRRFETAIRCLNEALCLDRD